MVGAVTARQILKTSECEVTIDITLVRSRDVPCCRRIGPNQLIA